MSTQTPLEVPLGGGSANTPYPDYDVAAPEKWRLDWDEKTQRLVADRVHNVPAYEFFLPEESTRLEAICARLIPQEDRPEAMRIPIAPWIDRRLHLDEGDGYIYDGMPGDREAYRQGLRGFGETAQALFHRAFASLNGEEQDEVIHSIAGGQPIGIVWETLPAKRFFALLMKDVITNYYAHPMAWAEIGFRGPASPRGHIRLSLGFHDKWEAEERQPRASVEIVRRALEGKESQS